MRSYLPLLLVPEPIYEALCPIAEKSNDFIAAVTSAIGVFLVLWLLIFLSNSPVDVFAEGWLTALRTVGFRAGAIGVAVLVILGMSYWTLLSINELEKEKQQYYKYQTWSNELSNPQR